MADFPLVALRSDLAKDRSDELDEALDQLPPVTGKADAGLFDSFVSQMGSVGAHARKLLGGDEAQPGGAFDALNEPFRAPTAQAPPDAAPTPALPTFPMPDAPKPPVAMPTFPPVAMPEAAAPVKSEESPGGSPIGVDAPPQDLRPPASDDTPMGPAAPSENERIAMDLDSAAQRSVDSFNAHSNFLMDQAFGGGLAAGVRGTIGRVHEGENPLQAAGEAFTQANENDDPQKWGTSAMLQGRERAQAPFEQAKEDWFPSADDPSGGVLSGLARTGADLVTSPGMVAAAMVDPAAALGMMRAGTLSGVLVGGAGKVLGLAPEAVAGLTQGAFNIGSIAVPTVLGIGKSLYRAGMPEHLLARIDMDRVGELAPDGSYVVPVQVHDPETGKPTWVEARYGSEDEARQAVESFLKNNARRATSEPEPPRTGQTNILPAERPGGAVEPDVVRPPPGGGLPEVGTPGDTEPMEPTRQLRIPTMAGESAPGEEPGRPPMLMAADDGGGSGERAGPHPGIRYRQTPQVPEGVAGSTPLGLPKQTGPLLEIAPAEGTKPTYTPTFLLADRPQGVTRVRYDDQDWWYNGFIAEKGDPDARVQGLKSFKWSKSTGTPPSMNGVFAPVVGKDQPVTPAIVTTLDADNKSKALGVTVLANDTLAVALDSRYYGYFKSRYPDAEFSAVSPSDPIVVRSAGEIVGAAMPVKIDRSVQGQVSGAIQKWRADQGATGATPTASLSNEPTSPSNGPDAPTDTQSTATSEASTATPVHSEPPPAVHPEAQAQPPRPTRPQSERLEAIAKTLDDAAILQQGPAHVVVNRGTNEFAIRFTDPQGREQYTAAVGPDGMLSKLPASGSWEALNEVRSTESTPTSQTGVESPQEQPGERAGTPAGDRRPGVADQGALAELRPEPARGVQPEGNVGERSPEAGRVDAELRRGAPEAGAAPERSVGAGDAGARAGGVSPAEPPPAVHPDAAKAAEPVTRKPRSLATSADNAPGHDYVIGDRDLADLGGAVARFDANVEAIKLLRRIQAENRLATPDEQAVLVKYVGWGDTRFSPAFEYYTRDAAWAERKKVLEALLSPEELEAARGSRLNAHYTAPEVVKAVWSALDRLGVGALNRPRLLEPSGGIGHFFGLQPPEMAARSQRTAVELDKVTGGILRQLYQNAEVYIAGFEKAPLADNAYDVALSNVPFGEYGVTDAKYGAPGRKFVTRLIHDYFFVKALDKVRPGGVVAFITSQGTMNKGDRRVREEIAKRADLLGAVRLPRTAFKENAGTEVVTDVIFLRKRLPDEAPSGPAWMGTAAVTGADGKELRQNDWDPRTAFPVNEYFIAHPENVLGEHSDKGSMYSGREYTVEPRAGDDTAALLRAFVDRLPRNVVTPIAAGPDAPAIDLPLTDLNTVHGRLRVHDGKAYVWDAPGGGAGAWVDVPATGAVLDRLKGLVGIRDQARRVLEVQRPGNAKAALGQEQAKLNKLYDAFVAKHGPLNKQSNRLAFKSDPDSHFLRSLEKWNDGWAEKLKGRNPTAAEIKDLKEAIFSKPTVRQIEPVQSAATPKDAMLVALNEYGRVHWDRMAELTGESVPALQKALTDQGLVYENPEGGWETADEYLSGYVRDKLRSAEMAADANPKYARNVGALKRVQPADKPPSRINVKLGAPWMPETDFDAFTHALLAPDYLQDRQPRPVWQYLPATSEWVQQGEPLANDIAMNTTWGTRRVSALQLIDLAMNAKRPTVYDLDENDNRIKNVPETMAAQAKQDAIREAFAKWVWKDGARAKRLAAIFNERFNNYVPREYDGSHLTFPGMAGNLKGRPLSVRPHQASAIWRFLQRGTVGLFHEVGFGKTISMQAMGMEARRLGLSRKNVYVVPNHLVPQFASEFRAVYPSASLLVAEKDSFKPSNRKEMMARIATGDWDGVIVGQSQFTKLPLTPETEMEFRQEQLRELEDSLLEANEQAMRMGFTGKKKTTTQKRLEAAKKRLEKKLADKAARLDKRRDDVLYWEELGVDQLFVDEADSYKNLYFSTHRDRVKGMPSAEADYALDMYMKSRWLQQRNGGRGVVFATGTPVANTIAELWTMMRYLMPDHLKGLGIATFDAWANQFADTTFGIEQTVAGGYRPTERFAKFVNAMELSKIFQHVADIRMSSELKEMEKLKPRIVGEVGKPGKRVTVTVPATPELKAYMDDIVERVEKLGPPEPGADNMLSIAGDARKASLDIRLVVPGAPEDANSKLNLLAGKVHDVYEGTTADRGAQLVFLDLGTPKASDKVTDLATASDEDAAKAEMGQDDQSGTLTGAETTTQNSVYESIRQKLVGLGIPRKEIAFIHEADTNEKKSSLYARVNAGDVRVLIGSTSKLGAGTNVQERLAAVHHVDAPWRPRDIEQREGRVRRPGNVVYGPSIDPVTGEVTDPGKGIRVYQYVSERPAFDGYIWQALEAKARAIGEIMRRNVSVDEVEDADEFVLSAAEARALASGDPDVMKLVQIKVDVAKLAAQEGDYLDRQVDARQKVAAYPGQIERARAEAAQARADQALRDKASEKFSITLGNNTYDDREAAAGAIETVLKQFHVSPIDTMALGSYKGFDLTLSKRTALNRQISEVRLSNPDSAIEGQHYATTGFDAEVASPGGIVTRIVNALDEIDTKLKREEREAERLERLLPEYRKVAEDPSPYAERLAALQREQNRIERKLQGEDVSDIAPLDMNAVPIVGEAPALPEPEPELEAEPEPVEIEAPRPAPVEEVPPAPEPVPEEEPAAEAAPAVPEPADAEKPHKYDNGSTQIDLPDDVAEKMRDWAQRTIPKSDLAEDGYEDEPHVTVQYGLTSPGMADEVEGALANVPPPELTFGTTGIFPGEKYDVVYLKIEHDGALERARDAIRSASPGIVDTHPKYTPHATLAYVKPGLGKKYDGLDVDGVTGERTTPDVLAVSDRDGVKTDIEFGGAAPEPVAAATEAAPEPPPAVHPEATATEQREPAAGADKSVDRASDASSQPPAEVPKVEAPAAIAPEPPPAVHPEAEQASAGENPFVASLRAAAQEPPLTPEEFEAAWRPSDDPVIAEAQHEEAAGIAAISEAPTVQAVDEASHAAVSEGADVVSVADAAVKRKAELNGKAKPAAKPATPPTANGAGGSGGKPPPKPPTANGQPAPEPAQPAGRGSGRRAGDARRDASEGMPGEGEGGAYEPQDGRAGNINLEKYQPDAQKVILQLYKNHPEEFAFARGGAKTQTDEQVNRAAQLLADAFSANPTLFVEGWAPGQAWNAVETQALRLLLDRQTLAIADAKTRLAAKDAGPEQQLAFVQALADARALQTPLYGITAEAGRALRVHRQEVNGALSGDAKAMRALIKKMGGVEKLQDVADAFAKLDMNDPDQVARFVRNAWKPSLWDYATELLYNSWLGPKTLVVKSISDALSMAMLTVERPAAVPFDMLLSAFTGKRTRYMGDLPATVHGFWAGRQAAGQALRYTLRHGFSQHDAATMEFGKHAFQGTVGRVIRAPTNAIEATVEFFYMQHYYGALYTRAFRQATGEGLRGDRRTQRVADLVSAATADPDENPLAMAAMKEAKYRIYNQDAGKFTRELLRLRAFKVGPQITVGGRDYDLRIQPLVPLVPFLRIPVNLAKYGQERSPLGIFNPHLWTDLYRMGHAEDEGERERAQGNVADMGARMAVGTAIFGSLMGYALAGNVTGEEPKDAAERDRWRAEGKLPWAIKVAGRWYSFQRIEPLNEVLTDVAIVASELRDHDWDRPLEERAGRVVLGIARNMVSQNYMVTLSDALDALTHSDDSALKFIQRQAAGYVPWSSTLRAAAQTVDTTERKPTGILQQIEANTPFLSRNVAPAVDAFGNTIKREGPAIVGAVNPVQHRTADEGAAGIVRELERHNVSFSATYRSISGVPLEPDEQEQFRREAGPLTQQYLERTVASGLYQAQTPANQEKLLRAAIRRAHTEAARIVLRDIGAAEARERLRSVRDQKDARALAG
jgi:N12 class adenine-specific DNA methylase/2'-5' RNA ligase